MTMAEQVHSFIFILPKTLNTSDSRGPFSDRPSRSEKVSKKIEKFYRNSQVLTEKERFCSVKNLFQKKATRVVSCKCQLSNKKRIFNFIS
jgi:hypothetical protein